MNSRFLCLLIVISQINSLIAQKIQSGSVVYKVTSDLANSKNLSGRLNSANDYRLRIISKQEELEFILSFNVFESQFSLVKNMSIDEQDGVYKIAKQTATLGSDVYFTDTKSNTLTEQANYLGDKLLIETNLDDIDWTITKESKKISDYICYKAEGIRYFKNKERKKDSIKINAWFCPELNFNFGPFDAIGLPGLVLEYSRGHLVYSAQSVTFKVDPILLERPSDGQRINRNKLEEYIKNKM